MSDWSQYAACLSADPEELFADAARQNRAKAVCGGCPVRTECLAEALDGRIEFGVWGGMTARERRQLLRRKPGVTSWRHLLDSARRAHERPDRQPLAASPQTSCPTSRTAAAAPPPTPLWGGPALLL